MALCVTVAGFTGKLYISPVILPPCSLLQEILATRYMKMSGATVEQTGPHTLGHYNSIFSVRRVYSLFDGSSGMLKLCPTRKKTGF